jgi:hypothetical protein
MIPVPTIPEEGLPVGVENNISAVHQQAFRRWDGQQRTWLRTDEENADVIVTLETVDFNNGQIRLDWTVENRRRTSTKMALVPQNILITDNALKYEIDPTRSQPVGSLVVKPGEKQTATVVVPQSVRPNAITLRITLVTQPFGETSWIVNVPQQ